MFCRLQINKLYIIPEKFLISSRANQQLTVFKNDTTKYMPILDLSNEGRKRNERQLWYDSIKALPTVEQKLYELTQQHRPRAERFLLFANAPTYSATLFQRYITRTHMINHLPEKLTLMNVDDEYNEVADALKESLLSFYTHSWKCQDNKYKDLLLSRVDCSKLVNLLISTCYRKLALKNDYILESAIQQSARLESFWFHGGFYPNQPKVHLQNITLQFKDKASFYIRIRKPLNPILSLNDPLCATAEVPEYHYNPKTVGIIKDHKYITSVPGHWFDDPCCYPFLLVKTTSCLKNLLGKLQYYDLDRIKDSLGATIGFGCLNAAATYQGFTPFHDLTYPLVVQTIVTDGQDFNFYVYQLNTIAFHTDVDKRDRRNICWSSGTIRLFDAIEDGLIKGFNDEVFKILLKFLMNAPIPSDNVVLKPYLGTDNRTEDEFNNMRFYYRQMYSQAPDPRAYLREVPTWHRIYIKSKVAMPMPFVKLQ